MKINSITPGNIVERYNGKSKAEQITSEIQGGPDRVELSSDAQSFASVFNKVKDSIDVRSESEKEHIRKIAASIDSGTYSVSADDVAAKILGGNIDLEI